MRESAAPLSEGIERRRTPDRSPRARPTPSPPNGLTPVDSSSCDSSSSSAFAPSRLDVTAVSVPSSSSSPYAVQSQASWTTPGRRLSRPRPVLVPRHVPREPLQRPLRGSRSRTRGSRSEGWRRGSCPSTPCPRPAPVSARASRRPRRAGGLDVFEKATRRRPNARRSSPPSRSCGVFGRWRGGDGDGQSLGELTRRVGGRRSSEVRSRTGDVSGRTMYSKLSQTRIAPRLKVRHSRGRLARRWGGADSVGKKQSPVPEATSPGAR